MSDLTLRPYQSKMLDEMNEALAEGCEAVMGALPTGSGKTAVMAAWASQLGGKVLFVAPNLAIIEQLPEEFALWGMPAMRVGTGFNTWKKAQRWAGSTLNPAIAATPGTSFNNIKGVKDIRPFAGLIIDEAHHAPDPLSGKGTQTTQLVKIARRAKIPVIGMTATPWRMSMRQGFAKTWDVLINGPSWNDMKGIYLANIHMIRHGDQFIRGAGASSGQDYTAGATWTRNADNLIFTRGAFDMLLKHAMQPNGVLRKTIMYAVGQKHAVNLSKLAVMLGIPTGLLLSSQKVLRGAPKAVETDRHEVNRKFRSGEIRLVINVDMISEGYNLPDCDVVIILRPTMSVVKWLQMCGRGSRLTTEKDTLLLIDLTDNHERLGDPLMERIWTLDARVENADYIGEPVMRFCSDENGGSCNTMIFAGHRDCSNCGRAQGIECDTCGQFRVWNSFKTGEGYVRWVCDRCQHEEQAAKELQVLLIYKSWTKKGDLYYGLHLSDYTQANVFRFQRGPFNIINRAYQVASQGKFEEVEPKHTIMVETKWKGQFQNIIRARYEPTPILEDTRI